MRYISTVKYRLLYLIFSSTLILHFISNLTLTALRMCLLLFSLFSPGAASRFAELAPSRVRGYSSPSHLRLDARVLSAHEPGGSCPRMDLPLRIHSSQCISAVYHPHLVFPARAATARGASDRAHHLPHGVRPKEECHWSLTACLAGVCVRAARVTTVSAASTYAGETESRQPLQ
jgi:hypothetical protein